MEGMWESDDFGEELIVFSWVFVAFFATEEYVRGKRELGFCSRYIFFASAILHLLIVLIFKISFAAR